MNISDINYLKVLNTEIRKALAGGGKISFNITRNVDFIYIPLLYQKQ